MSEMKKVLIEVSERLGGLPYVVFWVSIDGRPHAESFETIEKADAQVKHLSDLDVRATCMVNLSGESARIVDEPVSTPVPDAEAENRLLKLIRDDELTRKVVVDCHDPSHDPRSCPTCDRREDGIEEYRVAILAAWEKRKEERNG